MLHVLTPDCVFETIFEITPAFLQKRGIRGALIDIDGTASSHRMRLPSEELCAYVDSLQKAKELPCVFNNWAIFYKGNFQTVNLPDEATLKRILKK